MLYLRYGNIFLLMMISKMLPLQLLVLTSTAVLGKNSPMYQKSVSEHGPMKTAGSLKLARKSSIIFSEKATNPQTSTKTVMTKKTTTTRTMIGNRNSY